MKGFICSSCFCFTVLALLAGGSVSAQESAGKPLVGSMRFEIEYDDIVTPMRYFSDGERMRVELGEPGDPYLIWIRGASGTDGIAILSPMNKNYSIEFDGPPIDDWLKNDGSIEKRRKPKEIILPKGVPQEYKGFQCIEYKLDTDGPDTGVWMLSNAQKLPFQLLQIWESLYDASRHIWKLSQEQNGIPLKIERKNWRGKAYFSLQLRDHDTTVPSKDVFSIPEGYHQIASQVRGGRRIGGGPQGARP